MKSDFNKAAKNIYNYVNNNINSINDSKIFAGMMIITLNIASKFVTIKLSKTMESYLKYTFSKQILVFVIAWMGTRNIYIALIVTTIFIICMDFLFNEESRFCCLPETFTDYYTTKLENDPTVASNAKKGVGSGQGGSDQVSDDEIKKAEAVLEKAKNNNKQSQSEKFTPINY